MRKLIALAMAASGIAAADQPTLIRIADNPIRQTQTELPMPATATPNGPMITADQAEAIARELRQMERIADETTVPYDTINGVRVVQAPSACESGQCLQIDLIDQPPPTIGTQVQQIAPQVQMVPRHVPPPATHSLLYGFDQSYPQLPIVDVDNDCGCSPCDHYDIAVITINGKPTQVLNPEPRQRNKLARFCKNLADLLHGEDD